MSDLQIEFDYMFLLVRRKDDNVVLSPKGFTNKSATQPRFPHKLTITYDNKKGTQRFPVNPADAGVDVSFHAFVNGAWQALGGKSSSGPTNGLIMHFRQMDDGDKAGRIRKELFTGNTPAELNARVFLPHGTFSHQQPRNNFDMNTLWDVRGSEGKRLQHKLTDVLTFSFNMPGSAPLGIKIGNGNIEELAGKKVVSFINDDESGPPQNPYVLDDFAVMYALARDPTGWTVPTRFGGPFAWLRKIFKSDERPICGGGQGCEEDGYCPPLEP